MCRSRTSNDSQASWATLEVVIAPLFSSESAYTTLSHQCEKTFIECAFFVRIEHERNIFSCCSMVSHVACVPNFRKRIVHKDELSSCDCLRSCAFGLHAVGPVLAKQHEGGARVSAAAGACRKRMDRFSERAGAFQCGRRSPVVGAISRSHS